MAVLWTRLHSFYLKTTCQFAHLVFITLELLVNTLQIDIKEHQNIIHLSLMIHFPPYSYLLFALPPSPAPSGDAGDDP